MTALAFNHVSILRGRRNVLSDVTLAIEPGEFIGMLGPNGSGKTTLIRAALGLQPIHAGSIRVFDAPVAQGNPAIGYMPQLHANVASIRFTGWDYVAAGLNPRRWGIPTLGASDRAEVDRVLDLVGARELAKRPLREMSGGERQRLLLSQALLGRPRLLLLDEPLINLDPSHQSGVIEIVRRLQQDMKLTIVFSAHELNPLIGVMSRVLYLAGGQAALGTVDEVITAPVLSRLYGSDIEVIHVKGRIFVMAGQVDVERDAHAHDHDHGSPHDHEHDHGAEHHAHND